ncbi:MAG: hypothetical protein ACOZAL_02670 [Patescibacteria group bacterium]
MSYRAYQNTQISIFRSQDDINKLFRRNGITQSRFTHTEKFIKVEFNYSIPNSEKDETVGVSIEVKIPPDIIRPEKIEQEQQRLFRVLLNHLKAKFEAVNSGLTEFGTEFLAHLILTLPSGETKTVEQIVRDPINAQILLGKSSVPLLEMNK